MWWLAQLTRGRCGPLISNHRGRHDRFHPQLRPSTATWWAPDIETELVQYHFMRFFGIWWILFVCICFLGITFHPFILLTDVFQINVKWERDIKILRIFINNVCHYHLSTVFALETKVYLLILDVYVLAPNSKILLLQIKTDSVNPSLLSLRLIISKFRVSW